MKITLENQVAIVTGASSGLGEAAARGLAKAGAAVVVNYHSKAKPARDLVKAIKADGGQAIAVGADVSKEDEVQAMFDKAIETYGHVDILVANSGLQKDAAADEMTLDDWNAVISVNLTGQFLCARAAIRQFKVQGVIDNVSRAAGKIIHMSSVHQQIPWAGHVNYAASKGGVNLLMQTLAQELAHEKIRVNGIAPGAIRTPINDTQTKGAAGRKLLKLIPYGRIGDPEDVTNAVVWLASDLSDYVVGTTLTIDGGMCLYPGFIDNG
jgi:glucose 1-dehydrogenase